MVLDITQVVPFVSAIENDVLHIFNTNAIFTVQVSYLRLSIMEHVHDRLSVFIYNVSGHFCCPMGY